MIFTCWCVFLHQTTRHNLTFAETENPSDHVYSLHPPHLLHTSSSKDPSTQLLRQGQRHQLQLQQETKICFLQSVFGEPSHPSIDKPFNATSIRQDNSNYEFYYFTNMMDLDTPGWTKILLTDLPYKRHITMSRLPKFLAWKIHPILQESCQLILYLDGHFRPRENKQKKFHKIAFNVVNSKYGLIHTTHPKGGSLTDEFERIVSGTKDTQANVDASLKWLQAQPDWYDNCTLYWNAAFGYDPTNPWFQKASLYFWDHYSQEKDSWRDQPLWAYTLHHFGIQPLTMRHDTLHSYILEDFDLKGDHHYDENTVSYAQRPSLVDAR